MSTKLPGMFTSTKSYKPFRYPWAYDKWLQSERMHWLGLEVPLDQDVIDWKTKLTPGEKNLMTQIFRFFTQADVDVASGYIDRFLPKIKATEVRMMMSSFAAREAIHIQAYSMLIDEVGMPESEYSAFLQYKEMVDKHEFMSQDNGGDVLGLLKDLAVFSAFGEGLQLFSSFAILLNFARFGKMKGMSQIISWSIRDESLHVEGMVQVFKTLKQELLGNSNWSTEARELNEWVAAACVKMVDLEIAFVDMAFEAAGNEVEGLTKEDLITYIKCVANHRLEQLGCERIYPYGPATRNPLDWVLIHAMPEHANFFETKVTQYSKGGVTGWDNAFD